jgi:hypothetical protein
MNTLNTMNTRKMNQKCSELELEIQKLSELEANEFAKLEQKFTEDDLEFAWSKGYEVRVNEEKIMMELQQQT